MCAQTVPVCFSEEKKQITAVIVMPTLRTTVFLIALDPGAVILRETRAMCAVAILSHALAAARSSAASIHFMASQRKYTW
jgi:hypothetical protein